MLFDRNYLNKILELKRDDIAEFCDAYLGAGALSDHLDRYEPFVGRKELCQYLGVGESTMTGWLKEDRIPLMAKEAFMLPMVLRVLRGEIQRLQEEAERPLILKNGDCYQICRFAPDEYGEVIGEVLADNIQDIQVTRTLVAGFRAQRLLKKCEDNAIYFANAFFEGLDYDDPAMDDLDELQDNIVDCRRYASDYEAWRRERMPTQHAGEGESRPNSIDAKEEKS